MIGVREQVDAGTRVARPRPGETARTGAGQHATLAATGAGRHATLATALLRLQRTAGNSAVSRLLQVARTGQLLARWTGSDVRPGSWNAESRAIGKTLRLAIDGIKLGYQGDDPRPQYTSEKAAGRAIVVVPSNTNWQREVDVLLHFHGHGEAYRELSAKSEYDEPAGTVRDVESEQIEQQLEASGRHMIAILPQGSSGSTFNITNAVAYVDEVLKLIPLHLPLTAQPKRGRVVVSSHSGGGVAAVDVAVALAAPASATEKQWLEAAPLLLFDSINGPGELGTVKRVMTSWLDTDLAILKAAGPARGQQLLTQRGLRFLSTFSPGGVYEAVNKGGTWTDAKNVEHKIAPEDSLIAARDGWFGKHKDELGTLEATLKAQYRIDHVEGKHIFTVSTGFPAAKRITDVTPAPAPLPKGAAPTIPAYEPGTGHLEQALRKLYPEAAAQGAVKSSGSP